MVLRRRRLLSVLKDNEIAPTVTSFPMLGVGDFIDSPLNFSSIDSASIYLPDYIINPHPRYLIFQLISSIFYFFVSLNFSIFQLIISFFHEWLSFVSYIEIRVQIFLLVYEYFKYQFNNLYSENFHSSYLLLFLDNF